MKNEITIKFAFAHACALHFIQNEDAIEEVGHNDYKYILNCARKLTKAIENNKQFNSIYTMNKESLILSIGKELDELEGEMIKNIKK